MLSVLVPVASAQAAPRWSDGPLKTEILNINCVSQIFGSPYLESEVGAYLGQYVDDGSPVVGEVFDIHIVLATLGNECAGTRPGIEIALPPGVTPAAAGPGIRCYMRSSGSQPFGPVTAAEGCPTRLRPGTNFHPSIPTWYSLNPEPGSPAAPAWPLPQGAQLEIQVPVVSDRVLNGIGDTSGCVCAVAKIGTINGTSEPEPQFSFSSSAPANGPYVNLFVFPAPNEGPLDPPGKDPLDPPPGKDPLDPPPGKDPADPPGRGRKPSLKAPAKLGLPGRRPTVKVSGLRSGDKVAITVKIRGRVVARASGRSTDTSLRLRLNSLRSRTALSEIRRGGDAVVAARITAGGQKPLVLKARSKVR
jgi:hypothetical protein